MNRHTCPWQSRKMAEVVLFWVYLLALWQPRIATGRSTNQRRSLTFFARHQRSFRRSRGSLTKLLFASSLLVLPPFQQMVRSLRASRRFWAAPRGQGFWEKNVRGLWCEMRRSYPDWEENQYLQHFRMSKDTFWYLVQTFGKYFEKQDTHLRRALPPAKRLAVVLHWLAQASSFSELAALYAIGKSTVVAVVHQGIAILHERLVHDAILFPTGVELEQVMLDFESLCGLPCCGGAIDGTFMPIIRLRWYILLL